MRVYDTFHEFMKSEAIPHQLAHPEWKRLDGWDRDPVRATKGNPDTFACFRHHGKTWKVHADTNFAPLMAAYNQQGDPFREVPTNGGRGTKLQTTPYSKWMFVYLNL